jgi:hypothetical protein
MRPSVVARPLTEARLLLEEAGVQVLSIVETAPPGGLPKGPMRVVRERWTAEGVHLVAAASIVLPGSDHGHDRD